MHEILVNGRRTVAFALVRTGRTRRTISCNGLEFEAPEFHVLFEDCVFEFSVVMDLPDEPALENVRAITTRAKDSPSGVTDRYAEITLEWPDSERLPKGPFVLSMSGGQYRIRHTAPEDLLTRQVREEAARQQTSIEVGQFSEHGLLLALMKCDRLDTQIRTVPDHKTVLKRMCVDNESTYKIAQQNPAWTRATVQKRKNAIERHVLNGKLKLHQIHVDESIFADVQRQLDAGRGSRIDRKHMAFGDREFKDT